MSLPAGGAARAGLRRLRGRVAPSPLILLYHRVAALDSDPQLLAVHPSRFYAQLEVLRERASPLPLPELVAAAREGRAPRRAVAVTFDDGYVDNLEVAEPLLRRHGVPATVFVATGWMGREREFWWDEVERVVLRADATAGPLEMEVAGEPVRWLPGDRAPPAAPGANGRGAAAWNVLAGEDPTPLHALYRRLCALLTPLREAERAAALEALRAWRGVGPGPRPGYRAMTEAEVRRLAADGLVGIGAHTVTHPLLAALPVAEQRREVRESRARLGEVLGRPPDGFAYPYGHLRSYTDETVAVVEEAGLAHACSNHRGTVGRGTDPLRLPRFVVRDWDAERFERELDGWFGVRGDGLGPGRG